ncbi:hypothetical protein CH330_02400 [candidate division WOR-3 bacterium JGI_Cruoil_03_51_56]|uniref:Uncharacterized protein n=1 Tax=candidate division WOR-3 bacterium JGI_Cruoil_03_51_56 TaxID=1973747 RepID=A0A235BW30_UNCW3|nr:MAG: hypothetical protein CH330_02400 [candidate division WOR-3 bacterium JGI_Cruoil_03_51_56]
MILPFAGLIAAAVLVGFGYFALWTAKRPDTPSNLGSFGKAMSIVMFCAAGLSLVGYTLMWPMKILKSSVFRPWGGITAQLGNERRPSPGFLEHEIRDQVEEVLSQDEELLSDQMEEFIDESDEFESRVREIVEDMKEEK